MADKTCIGCSREFSGKTRRGRCEGCYRKYVADLKRNGEFIPVPRDEYLLSERRASTGRSTPVGMSLQSATVRILQLVVLADDGCWMYMGSLDRYGYGHTKRVEGRFRKPHQIVYQSMVGKVDSGLQLDHVCHSLDKRCAGGSACLHRRCVNPDHLEPVVGSENNRRGLSPSAINYRKTHCVNGHEFTSQNTDWRPPVVPGRSMRRRCLACRKEYYQAKAKKSIGDQEI